MCFVLRERGFELKGRLVAERGVQAFLVVDLFDEGYDAAAGVAEVGVSLAVDLFGLQRLHEAFGLGVVARVARSAHASAGCRARRAARRIRPKRIARRDRNDG